MILDYFKLSVRNMRKRKLRSWLTMAGIFISIASVFVLISLSLGLQNAVEEQFQQLGTDKLFIMPSALMLAGPGSAVDAAGFSIEDANVVEKVSGVSSITYFVIGNAKIEYKEDRKYLQIVGVPEDKLEIFTDTSQYNPEYGRFFREGDSNKIVVGYSFISGKLFGEEIGVGRTITINGKEFKIQGIMKEIGNSQDDNAIYLTFDDFKDLFNSGDRIDQIMVQVKDIDKINEIAYNIEKRLLKYRDLDEKNKDFTILTPEELLASFGNILNIITGFLLGIAAISLLVGGIGIANTMYASVIERTKEIGTMKAVGAQNKDILLIFLIESGLLGLAGGIIGVLLGIGIGKIIEYIAYNQLGTNLLQISTPFYLIIGCLLFAFIAGAISGIWPAYRASRLNTVDALRYE